MKRLAFLLAFLLSACLAQPTPEPTSAASAPMMLSPEENPYAPKPGDLKWLSEGVVLTSVNLSERTDLHPARIQVNFWGSMPGTCSELRMKVYPPGAEYQIPIEVYTVADPNLNCENVFQQFEANILLGAYSPGRYFIRVNNKLIGDFVSY